MSLTLRKHNVPWPIMYSHFGAREAKTNSMSI